MSAILVKWFCMMENEYCLEHTNLQFLVFWLRLNQDLSRIHNVFYLKMILLSRYGSQGRGWSIDLSGRLWRMSWKDHVYFRNIFIQPAFGFNFIILGRSRWLSVSVLSGCQSIMILVTAMQIIDKHRVQHKQVKNMQNNTKGSTIQPRMI